jgi:2-oxoglutarate dehydrogenase E2 component (dihydrolipoamide succinyltransferase)
MPQLGESVVEGTITKWLKSVGDTVAEFDALLEVNTDKVDTEVPSPASGVVLEILALEGKVVHAGEILALIGEPGVSAQPISAPPATAIPLPDAPAQAHTTADIPPVAAVEASAPVIAGRHPGLGFISPVVAKIAREQGLDLAQVTGSGQNGRITKHDVLEYLQQRTAAPQGPAPFAAPQAEPGPVPPQAPSQPHPAALPPAPILPGDEILPMTTVRRAIAEHMVFSERTSPHVTTVMEVDLSRVVAHRAAHKDSFARDGVNLTFTAYFVAASVAALKAYPIANSSWSEQGIVLHRAIHIGVAASLGEEGLIVPVVKNADSLSLLGLARSINDLANRARSHKLIPDEVRGGTFTITNHGVSGSLFATPIINQPQCAILGVGIIQKRVIVINDAIAIRPMAYLSLTFDHRILDGAIADYFLGKVVESLVNWS